MIIVEGFFLEKFINICTHRQMFLWDLRRQQRDKMTLKLSVKAFKTIRPVAKKTGCKVRILRKRGLPFVLNRYKGRKVFLIGAVFFVVTLYIMTSFVWVVEVSGNNHLQKDLLLGKLSELGIRPGVLKYQIHTTEVVNEMMLDMSELSWVSVSVKGTRVMVEVRESVAPPTMVPKDKPCDIVASKDGIVRTLFAKAGQEIVKAGDTVTKGQVLISGTVPIKHQEDAVRQVHAMGSVEARTWYQQSVTVCPALIKTKRTGKSTHRYTLVLFGKELGIFRGKIPYIDYELKQDDYHLKIGKDLIFPFKLVVDRYYESEKYEQVLDAKTAAEVALEEAYQKVCLLIPSEARVKEEKRKMMMDENGQLIAVVTIECIEQIGITKELGETD